MIRSIPDKTCLSAEREKSHGGQRDDNALKEITFYDYLSDIICKTKYHRLMVVISSSYNKFWVWIALLFSQRVGFYEDCESHCFDSLVHVRLV